MANVVTKIDLVVVEVKTFTRRSQNTGQELWVFSGNKYPARIDCPDKEVLDLTMLKSGDNVSAEVELTYTTVSCISDSGKKYLLRMPTFKIKNIL